MNSSRFRELLESRLGDVKPLQEQSFPGTSSVERMDYREKSIAPFEEKFKKNLQFLQNTYSCIPTKSSNTWASKQIKDISSDTRTSILRTIFFIKENKSKILSTFNCDEKTLVFLFKLALSLGDQQTGLGTTFQDNENLSRFITKFDSIVSNILNTFTGSKSYKSPLMTAAKKVKGKEASVGTFQIHPSHIENLTKTQKLTGTNSSDSDLLYKDITVGILAVMELLWNTYTNIKKTNNFNGPSVDYNGRVIPGLSGDYNWDVTLSSYDWKLDKLSKKYCKTDEPGYLAPCEYAKKVYYPGNQHVLRKSKVLGIQLPKKKDKDGNYYFNVSSEILPNYLPLMTNGSATNIRNIKWYLDFVKNLSCFTKF